MPADAATAPPVDDLDAGADEEVAGSPETDQDHLPIHGVPTTRSRGQIVAHPDRSGYCALVKALHADGYWVCIDLTAVDYLTHPGRDLPEGVDPERFEVVVGLLNHTDRSRLRLRVQVPESDPSIDSLFAIHPGTEALEREVFDLLGISFTGHPDLTRILLPESWEGHPLRKDSPSGRIPVQFKGGPQAR